MLLVPAASTTESTAGKRRLEVMLLVPAASAAARAAPAETPGGRPALFYDGIGLEMRDFDFAEGSKDRCARRGRRVDTGAARSGALGVRAFLAAELARHRPPSGRDRNDAGALPRNDAHDVCVLRQHASLDGGGKGGGGKTVRVCRVLSRSPRGNMARYQGNMARYRDQERARVLRHVHHDALRQIRHHAAQVVLLRVFLHVPAQPRIRASCQWRQPCARTRAWTRPDRVALRHGPRGAACRRPGGPGHAQNNRSRKTQRPAVSKKRGRYVTTLTGTVTSGGG